MRRIVMFNRVTADGYFAGPDGNLDWVVPEEELDRGAAEGLTGADAILFGRQTYRSIRGILAARRRRLAHLAGPSLRRATLAGAPCDGELDQ